MGSLFLKRGEFARAREYYERARLQGCPDAGLALAALDQLLPGERSSPGGLSAAARRWAQAGQQRLAAEDWEEAFQCYSQGLQEAPQGAELWVGRGRALGWLGRAAEALQCYDQALQLRPQESSWWADRSAVLERLERYAKRQRAWPRP